MKELSFTLPKIFGNHMVLQRGKPVKIWGESRKPQTIRVMINEAEAASVRVAAGEWEITLPPMDACRSLNLRIVGDAVGETLTFDDIAVGEVWIAGGQSNMEFQLKFDAEAKSVLPAAYNPDVRFFDCPKIKFEGQEKEDDFSQFGFWRPLNPANALYYSAVGYYFASKVYEQYHVPVGIVGCNWGGTTAATWMEERYLRDDKALSVYVREYEAGLKNLDMAQYLLAEQKDREILKQPLAKKLMNYIMMHTPGKLLRPIISILVGSSARRLPVLGPHSENRPGGLYHTMLSKIAPFTARGVIWYQGESDDPKADLYARLFSTMIRCWRDTWKDALPFLFVQLAPYDRWLRVAAENFEVLREQQELVSKTVPKAYMVSIMDAGDKYDIHPKHKRPVGERLALLARGKVYGEDILCEAPEASGAKLENEELVIPFLHAGDGLHLKGDKLKSLELMGDGETIKPLEVTVARDALRVQAEGLQMLKNLEIRFAYRNFAEVNLYNSANLPAKPFRQVLQVNS